MREIMIIGLSGKPKTLTPDATKAEIISAIIEVADDQKLNKQPEEEAQ